MPLCDRSARGAAGTTGDAAVGHSQDPLPPAGAGVWYHPNNLGAGSAPRPGFGRLPKPVEMIRGAMQYVERNPARRHWRAGRSKLPFPVDSHLHPTRPDHVPQAGKRNQTDTWLVAAISTSGLDACMVLRWRVKVDLPLVVDVHDGIVPKDAGSVEICQLARTADDSPRTRPIGQVSR